MVVQTTYKYGCGVVGLATAKVVNTIQLPIACSSALPVRADESTCWTSLALAATGTVWVEQPVDRSASPLKPWAVPRLREALGAGLCAARHRSGTT